MWRSDEIFNSLVPARSRENTFVFVVLQKQIYDESFESRRFGREKCETAPLMGDFDAFSPLHYQLYIIRSALCDAWHIKNCTLNITFLLFFFVDSRLIPTFAAW